MEGHDYAIGIDSDGKMYRQDVAEENGEIEPYPCLLYTSRCV